jgi:hypothetical protein
VRISRITDQSYFLWGLSQEQLSRSEFPLGELSKDEVRENAGAAMIHGILEHVSVAGGDGVQWELMRMHIERCPPYSVQGLIVRFLRSEVQLRIIWNAYASGRSGDADAEETRAKLARLGAPAAALGARSE